MEGQSSKPSHRTKRDTNDLFSPTQLARSESADILRSKTKKLKSLAVIMAQKIWWPTNQRHYIHWYLELPIPSMNNFPARY